MKEYLLVGAGGMLGSVARYILSSYFLHLYPNAKFPWGTFFVNIAGCLLIGVVAGVSEKLSNFNTEIRLALITGLIGGFTTFSAFGLETLHLFKEGAVSTGLCYALSSVVLGILCVYLGLKVTL